jgi:tetratricopeptide (TPR) repeat protein
VIYGLPAVPRPGMLTDVCERLAGWAAPQGKIETAIGFAQGAALAEPMDPRAASLVGEIAASFEKHARAESWFQRAVGIARRRHDWRTYARSYHGMAMLALHRGALRDAEERFRLGLRAARRNGFRSEQADGYIGLLRVAVETGRFDEARKWEELARRLVGSVTDKLQELAAASVELWMHTGDYTRALEGLEILRLDATSREQRMYVLARIAHAAAGIRDFSRLSDAWPQAWILAEATVSASRAVRYRTFIELHRAAALSRDLVRAARALNAAARLAQLSSEVVEVGELRQGGAGQNVSPDTPAPSDEPAASWKRRAGDTPQ